MCHRLSVLSFKLLNFRSAPQILKNDIVNNFLELSSFQLNPLLIPESIRKLRSRAIYISSTDIITKYKLKTFSFFSSIYLNCFDLNIFDFSFRNFLIFQKDYINLIYTFISKTFTYFNLELKSYTWFKALD